MVRKGSSVRVRQRALLDFHVAMRATPDGMPADDHGRVAGYDAQFAAVARPGGGAARGPPIATARPGAMTRQVGDEAEVEVDALLHKLRTDGEATATQLDHVRRALDVYDELGVVRAGRALPLHEACACAAQCWEPFGSADRPDAGHAGVSVPFVGWDYEAFRICVVGINLHDYGGLGANWWVCRGHMFDRLGKGKRSHFAYGTGAYLAALRASLDGKAAVRDRPTTEAAADGWRAAAFVEAVKCAPRRNTSKPSAAMWSNCPPLFLVRELELLAPRVLLVLGRTDVTRRVTRLLDAAVVDSRPSFERARGQVAGRAAEIVCCNHPARGGWPPSFASLTDSLAQCSIQA